MFILPFKSPFRIYIRAHFFPFTAIRTDMLADSFITCYGNDCRTGTFQSVNYPDNYVDRWMAAYLLFIPGATRIEFTFTGSAGFGVETHKDELYVGTGLTFSLNDFTGADILETDRTIRFFDNSTLKGNVYPPGFSLETDSVWLYFLTDKNLEFSGWQLSWTSTGLYHITVTSQIYVIVYASRRKNWKINITIYCENNTFRDHDIAVTTFDYFILGVYMYNNIFRR